MSDEVLTLPQAAEYLKMSKSKLYKLARLKRLPTFKVDKNVRVLRSDLEKWIASLKEQAR